jgi:cytoskeletal protein CcmA (bactofilin family)
MATQVQFRRGSTTENNAFTGAAAELTVDTTLTTVRVHDGTTAGGVSLVNVNSAQTVTNKTLGSGNTWQGNAPTLAYGGTGDNLTAVQGGIVYSTASEMAIGLAGTAGQVLTSGGTAAPIWVTPSSLTVGTASVASTAQNITGGSAGYLVYQYAENDTSFIEPGAAGEFLRSTGASTPPDWAAGQITFGSTTVDLDQTSTFIEGLTAIDGTTGATNFFTTPTGSTNLLTSASAISIGASTSTTTVNDDLVVTGNLTVNGETTTINSTTLTVDDKNIVIAQGAADSASADGAGITVDGANANITYNHAGTQWELDKPVYLSDTTDSSSSSTGALIVAGGIGAAGNIVCDGEFSIVGDIAVNGGDITTDDATFNFVTSTATTLNMGLAATTVSIGASTGTTTVNNNLVVTGTTTFNGGTINLGDAATDNVVFGADVNSSIEPNTDSTYNLGSNSQQWNNVYTVNTIASGDVAVNGGDLTTTAGTFNLINANATTANIAGAATSVNIGASTGTLTVNNAQTVFDSTDSIQIPVGTTAQRDGTPAVGQIRYNSTISSFEGYGPGNAWGSLGGVKDVDQDTYLLTEASAGSDEDTFEFFNAGTNTAALDTTALELKNDVYLQFDTGSAAHPSHSEGAIFYSAEYHAPTYYNDIAGVSNQIGLEEWIRVKNVTGSTIANGTPVYVTGASGEVPTVAPADATTEMKARVIGVATHDIANNAEGVATVRGLVSGIDTSALTAGQPVHVGADGSLQTAAPTAPYFPTDIGGCIVSDATDGYIYVRVQEHTMEQLRVTGNTKMDGNLTIAGDLTVSGTQTITSQANLALDNAFIYMNSGDTIGEANTTFSGSGLDDAYFAGHFEGTSTTSYYVRIDGVGTGTGGVDTFEWSKDNWSTTEATGVDLATTVELDNNITIKFNATTGHTDNDQWSGTAAPLNTDTGWASNRNTGTSGVGYTHLGVVWDTASSQMIMFDTYDPEIEGNIDTGHASFSYAPLQIDGLTATTGSFSSNGSFGGTLTVTGGTTLNSSVDINGNLDVSGNITSSSGAISFGNENLSTTGTLASGNLTVTGTATISSNVDINGSLDVAGNITSSSGAISFGNENLSTTGTLSAGAISGSSLNVSTGAVTAGSLDISGNADIDGTMEADAYTVNGTALNEYIADTVGAMVGGNSESGISVTYEDTDNTLDFNVGDFTITLGGDLSGNATITNLASATLNATINANSVALGTDTTGAYVADIVAGTAISISETNNGGENNTVTINHADTSTLSGTYGSTDDGTKIDQITVDANGHITAISTGATLDRFIVEDGDGTEVVINRDNEWKFTEGGGININWTDTSPGSDGDPYDLQFSINTGITAGSGLTGGGTLNATRTISHADTSSQASVNNSGNTFIQDITLDTFGHITGINSATVPVPTASSLGLGTSSDVQFDSLGVGTAASGTTGEIRATSDITSNYSDERLKKDIELIPNAIEKVMSLRGVTYHSNEIAESFGYDSTINHVGVIAQDVKAVLPEAVKPAPFDRMIFEGTEISKSGEDYMTVQYEKLVPLLIEAMKDQQKQIDELKAKLGE